MHNDQMHVLGSVMQMQIRDFRDACVIPPPPVKKSLLVRLVTVMQIAYDG
jgi:hypothetical protein